MGCYPITMLVYLIIVAMCFAMRFTQCLKPPIRGWYPISNESLGTIIVGSSHISIISPSNKLHPMGMENKSTCQDMSRYMSQHVKPTHF